MIRKTGSILLAALTAVSMLGIPGGTAFADTMITEDNSITETADREIREAADPGADTFAPEEEVFSDETDVEEAEDFSGGVSPEETGESAVVLDEAEYRYNPDDWRALPDRWFHIDQRDGWCDSENGESFNFEITAVEPMSENWENVIEIREDSDEQSHWWDIHSKDPGEAVLKITGKTDRETFSYNFNISIKEDLYGFEDISTDSNQEHYLPGEEYVISADPFHYSSAQEREGDFSNVTFEWELAQGAEAVKEFVPFPDDPTKVKVVLKDVLPEGWDHASVWARICMKDENGEILSRVGWVVDVKNGYSEIYPTRVNGWMNPGESEKIIAELRDYPGENGNAYETRKNVAFRILYNTDLMEVLDAKGNPTGGRFDDYEEIDIAEAAADGTCELTIHRLKEWEDRFLIQALEQDEKGEWQEICSKEYFLRYRDIDIGTDCDHDIDVFTDAEELPEIPINIGKLGDNWRDSFDLDLRVGYWDEATDWTGYLNKNDYNVDEKENCLVVTLKKAFLETLEDWTDIRVYAGLYIKGAVRSDETRLRDTDAWFHIQKNETKYDREWDRSLLPGSDGTVNGHYNVYVRNAEHPYGEDLKYTVTNVEKIEDNPWEPENGPVVVDFHRDQNENDPDDYWWYYRTENYGDAKFKVTYLDLEGKKQSYEFNLYVGRDVYSVDLFTSDGSWKAFPGGTLELIADARHEYLDDQGEYHRETTGFGYEWGIESGDEFAKLEPDKTDSSKAVLKFNPLPEGWDSIGENVRVYVKILDAEGNETNGYTDRDYQVETEYCEIAPFTLDGDLDIGSSIKDQKFEVRKYVYGKSGCEVLDDKYDIRYEAFYDENALKVIEKGNGVFTITRLRERGTELKIKASWDTEDGSDERWIGYWFPDRELEFSFEFDEEKGVEVFDDYRTTVSLNTEKIDGFLKLSDARIDYEIGYWEGEEGTDSWNWVNLSDHTALYSKNGTSITLCGDQMKKETIGHLDVCAILLLNDEEVIETWCWSELKEACPTHKWTETVITPASQKANGALEQACSVCGEKREIIIPKAAAVTLSKTSFTYNAKAQAPSVTVKDANGKALAASDYTVTYSNKSSTNAGTYKVTVQYKKKYTGSQALSYTIGKAANTLKVSKAARTADVKFKKKKSTKAKTVAGLKVTNKGQGKITYKKVKVNKNAGQFTVNSKTGKITVKKGTKAGTYKVTISASAAGNGNYNAGKAQAVVTVKVK